MSATDALFTGRHVHLVKSWPENFAAVLAGRKTFELRRDDRAVPYRCGDLIKLQEWVPPDREGASPGYTQRSVLFLIGHVSRGECVPTGWCAFELISTETALRVAAAILRAPR